MDCIVHGVSKRQTQLSDFHFTPLFSGLSVFPLNWFGETFFFLNPLDLIEKTCPLSSASSTPFVTPRPGSLHRVPSGHPLGPSRGQGQPWGGWDWA